MSKRYILFLCTLGLGLGIGLSLSLAGPVFAQAEQTPENLLDEPLPTSEENQAEPETDAEASPASGETDYNEENFRRSMELRDRQLQRSPDLTTGSYSTGTGLQALDDLPETSQKHLREQLREVIVREGPWTPEAAGERYPYEPSEAARENPGLKRREQTAWGELVAEYHEREAAIHANAARTSAATAAGRPAGADANASANAGMNAPAKSANDGQAGKPGDPGDTESARSAGDESRQDRNQTMSEAGGAPPAAETEQGVTQNALQLLQERRQLPPSGSAAPAEAAAQTAIQASAQTSAQELNDEAAPLVELDSEDVIAIEDLKNVEIDVNAEKDN